MSLAFWNNVCNFLSSIRCSQNLLRLILTWPVSCSSRESSRRPSCITRKPSGPSFYARTSRSHPLMSMYNLHVVPSCNLLDYSCCPHYCCHNQSNVHFFSSLTLESAPHLQMPTQTWVILWRKCKMYRERCNVTPVPSKSTLPLQMLTAIWPLSIR